MLNTIIIIIYCLFLVYRLKAQMIKQYRHSCIPNKTSVASV